MKKRILSAVLAALLVLFCACGKGGETAETGDSTTESVSDERASDYDYPDLDCGGDSFTILNTENLWGMYTYLDFEEMTGEMLDDAVYNRNIAVEQEYNVVLDVQEASRDDLPTTAKADIMAGDGTYDIIYCGGDHISSLLGENYLYNLRDVPEFRLDEPWWNQKTLQQIAIGDDAAVYFAQSDLSLTAFELTWCLMFNETMMEELSIEKPYDMVRDGTWTFDKMAESLKHGTGLNGDESFEFSADGSSVYGMASFDNSVQMFLTGADIRYISGGSDGVPEFSLESDRFYTAVEKIAGLMGTEGDFIIANTSSIGKHYATLFKAGRALYIGAEIKESANFRDFGDTFGIVPTPKLDENQDDYHSWTNYYSLVMALPVTNTDPARAGIIMDTLSYLSTRDVMPVYYDVNVSQKGLRNDDSIEMLSIIRDSLTFDPSLAYGWTMNLHISLRTAISQGNSAVASTVAAAADTIRGKISATMEQINS